MRVAIFGCGQLARMMALAGIPLGIKFSFLADGGPDTDTRCVDGLGDVTFWRPGLEGESLYQALNSPDVITVEKEQVELQLVASLEGLAPIMPSVEAINVCKNRKNEKSLLDELGIPSARYAYVDTVDSFEAEVKSLPFPLVVKSISDGYDGKAQWRIKELDDMKAVPDSAIEGGVIIEEWVPFLREVSLVGVRDSSGEMKFYPITENVHENGILVRSIAPANDLTQPLIEKVEGYMQKIMESLSYVGVLAMECFVTKDDVLVNELAPRVHNSGHWTQQGAVTCQFQNHMRAITGLPIGSTECHGVAGMINVLGPATPPPRELITEYSTFHWYGKTDKHGRKLGHVNFVSDSREKLEEDMQAYLSKTS
ncbi:MAG: 5-(carboxyamino)imidazole ribonucleotide synthase [Pseudomonadales bacterium]|nr:5-(carboxyamino)imidazole ribonucleotide synthase [Pseudomonadales bacterium]